MRSSSNQILWGTPWYIHIQGHITYNNRTKKWGDRQWVTFFGVETTNHMVWTRNLSEERLARCSSSMPCYLCMERLTTPIHPTKASVWDSKMNRTTTFKDTYWQLKVLFHVEKQAMVIPVRYALLLELLGMMHRRFPFSHGGTPTSSILDWEFPWNKPSSELGNRKLRCENIHGSTAKPAPRGQLQQLQAKGQLCRWVAGEIVSGHGVGSSDGRSSECNWIWFFGMLWNSEYAKCWVHDGIIVRVMTWVLQ